MLKRAALPLIIAAATVFTGSAVQAAHWDRPSCYIDVHDGCFNTQPPCSKEDYNLLLDNCDTTYPSGNVVKPKYGVLVAPTKAVIDSRAYRLKMERLRTALDLG
jgi:hypothetical protein